MANGLDYKKEVVSFTAMAVVECINVSLNTLYKAATLKGLSYFVFVTYSYAFGALVLLPFIFIFPKRELPPLTLSLLYRIILLSVIGYGGNICAFKGIEYTSPALASAISNLPPAFTFILAVVFRMETLDLRSSRTQAKTIGTILSVSGALIAILYNGPVILSAPTASLPLEHSLQTAEANWVIGGILLFAFCILVSVWYILQTHVIKLYPSELTVVVLFSLFTSIIAATVSFMVGTDTSAWALRTDMALLTIVLFGFFGPSFSAAVHTWGLNLKGPVYVAVFRPFSFVIAAAMGVIFLGDALYLGSVIGATILLIGFYAVIWGKAKDETSKDFAEASVPEDRKNLLTSSETDHNIKV